MGCTLPELSLESRSTLPTPPPPTHPHHHHHHLKTPLADSKESQVTKYSASMTFHQCHHCYLSNISRYQGQGSHKMCENRKRFDQTDSTDPSKSYSIYLVIRQCFSPPKTTPKLLIQLTRWLLIFVIVLKQTKPSYN